MHGTSALLCALVIGLLLCSHPACAQDNYEIQVYGAETVPPRHTMFELHSNYTVRGTRTVTDGVLPTQDAFHETLETTHGFTDQFETGFYIFTSARHDEGWQFVGSHIRPRWRAPERWKWPVGISVSLEAGWQARRFSTDTWTLEVRPIIDKQIGRWYLAFNPTFDRALVGENAGRGFVFSPNAQVGYDVTAKVNLAVEYYGSVGPFLHYDPFQQQQQQIAAAINLNVGPDWELNFGVVYGLTHSTDNTIVKVIVGRRLDF